MSSAARSIVISVNQQVFYIYGPERLHIDPLQLIVFFSKSLLRHPKARSDLSEMIGETHFQRYLPDPHPENLVAPEQVRRHILCTGIYLSRYQSDAC